MLFQEFSSKINPKNRCRIFLIRLLLLFLLILIHVPKNQGRASLGLGMSNEPGGPPSPSAVSIDIPFASNDGFRTGFPPGRTSWEPNRNRTHLSPRVLSVKPEVTVPRGMLKTSLLVVGSLSAGEAPEGLPSIPAEVSIRLAPHSSGILSVVKLWATAWIDGDVEGMFACLHPHLAKHILGVEPQGGPSALRQITGPQSLLGTVVHEHLSEANVWVLDVLGHSGSARVDLGPWTAFIHLAVHNNRWAIANVLWEWRNR
ncbi:MAG: hypothetical protein D0530_08000 [Methylococcales bacterium]|nr:MAG: hypothetical protein D0530_08000 [Methylococcales bacterium]